MNDQDWINLQKLTGRAPQPWALPPETPDHILAAQAMERLLPELGPMPEPTPEQQMYADALDAHIRRASSDPDSSTIYNSAGPTTDTSNSAAQSDGALFIANRQDKKKECIERCSDLALPTGNYGVAFHRCVATCLGEADWPEWKKHFPNNRDNLPQLSPAEPQPAPQSAQPPWWLPLVPFLIRVAPAAAAAAV